MARQHASRFPVTRDGAEVGYAIRTSGTNDPERWTAFVYIPEPPFDAVRVGFESSEQVRAFIAKNGTPKTGQANG